MLHTVDKSRVRKQMRPKYGISRDRTPVVFLFLSLCVCLATTSAGTSFIPKDGPIRSTMEKLAAATISTAEENNNSKDNEAKLWRQLGKLQLDAGEYAEARQIFCSGAKACPFDEGLQHHLRVYDAFHGKEELWGDNEDTITTTRTTSSSSFQKPLPFQIQSHPDNDMFLSLDVPDAAIPKSVKNWKGNIPPDTRTRLLHATKDPFLPPEACRFLIQSALEAVTKRGWTKDRHVHAPTCDIPVFDLSSEALSWCRQTFHKTILPLIASTVSPELDVDPQDLRIQDCFIVRYDGNGEGDGPGFESLKPHQDESLLSLTIALNDMDDYSDGGLFIQSTGDLLNGNAGTVMCFAGGLVHGGYPVTRGTRWILTVFLYVNANESGEDPGYTLRALDKLRTNILKN